MQYYTKPTVQTGLSFPCIQFNDFNIKRLVIFLGNYSTTLSAFRSEKNNIMIM